MENVDSLLLPSEADIVRHWPIRTPAVVSVICLTYNHETVIEDALRGFLIQETKFPFEILIHDDASSDRTQEIVMEYARRYPRILKPICQAENQLSRGVKIIPAVLARAEGEYVALCDGDDYWVAPDKLRRQVRVLEENEGVDLCWHECHVLEASSGKMSPRKSASCAAGIVPLSAVIENDGGFIPTLSILMRRVAIEKMPEWFHSTAPISDYFYQIYAARRGGGICLKEVMGVSRSNLAGSWTRRTWTDAEKRMRFEAAFRRCLQCAEVDFPQSKKSFAIMTFRHFTPLGLFGLKLRSREIFRFARGLVLGRSPELGRLDRWIATLVFLRIWYVFLK